MTTAPLLIGLAAFAVTVALVAVGIFWQRAKDAEAVAERERRQHKDALAKMNCGKEDESDPPT